MLRFQNVHLFLCDNENLKHANLLLYWKLILFSGSQLIISEITYTVRPRKIVYLFSVKKCLVQKGDGWVLAFTEWILLL